MNGRTRFWKTKHGGYSAQPKMAIQILSVAILFTGLLSTQTLPGTQALTMTDKPIDRMLTGFSAYLSRATDQSAGHRNPTRDRLRHIIGAVEPRLAYSAPELIATVGRPSKLTETSSYSVSAVRWPVLDGITADGLLFEPKGPVVARVVALPDADQSPEDTLFARRLAENGCQVLVPALIDRKDTWSGNPRFRMTNQPHREYIYRMAFPVGHHIIGYEVQKALAAVDWFEKESKSRKVPIGVWGYGEGGLLALYAAALDPRIDVTVVSGYFQSRQQLWTEPIYRNVWALLRDFGDAEMAGLISPRRLIVETRQGPLVSGPPPPDEKRSGAAPGKLELAAPQEIQAEFDRAKKLNPGVELASDAIQPFLKAFGVKANKRPADTLALRPNPDRLHRQFLEIVEYTQKLVRQSELRRDDYWSKADMTSVGGWESTTKIYRDQIWDNMIGRLPAPTLPMNPRSRHSYKDAKWDGYDVSLDLFPDVFAYGVLLVPKGIKPGERRPVVVAQHGLNGTPQSMFQQAEVDKPGGDFHYYQNVASKLADMGFVVYCPQNFYTGQFREVQRQANPLQLSLFSFTLAQHERLLDWLETLPFVDAKRIGFYGLSYGGKTAVRVPPLLGRYALSICSADFNEWVIKLTSVDRLPSYMHSQEYEIYEWNLANTANYAELSRLMAPRPFMVERGHGDGVALDQWVGWEYAKVQRFYDLLNIGDRTRIELFNGPHQMHLKGTVEFLRKFLDW